MVAFLAALAIAPLYAPAAMEAELRAAAARHPQLVRLASYGASAEGRPLLVARLGPAGAAPKPMVFALFGLHPDEHDMNTLGMALVRRLAAGYGMDPRVTRILDRYEVAVVPMANPDGTVHDLAAPVPFSWRNSRRPRAGGFGADLNRNWGGEAPFSEPESASLRDWLLAQPVVAGCFDFHSGASGFNQGMVLVPEPDQTTAAVAQRNLAVARALATALALPTDRREPFWVLPPSGVRQALADAMGRHIPAPHRARAIASLPADTRAPGAFIGWAQATLHAPALGLELSRPWAAADLPGYAQALENDYQERAPRYLDGFLAAAAALAD